MSLRKRAVFGLSLAVAATGFYAHPASANPAGTGLVISEVYGAGGNGGAVYNADFVEIFNPTTGSLDLTGMSVQYRSATGTGTGSFALSGSVAAGDTYLVQMSAPGANGAALTPDATADPAFTMSGSDGQVLLKASTDAFSGSGNLAGNAALVDMVGYGDGATSFEGAPTGDRPHGHHLGQAVRDRCGHRQQRSGLHRDGSEPRHDPEGPGRPHDCRDPGHRRREPAGRRLRDHPGRRHRALPQWRLRRLLHSDRRQPRHRGRIGRALRLRPGPPEHGVARDRRVGGGRR